VTIDGKGYGDYQEIVKYFINQNISKDFLITKE
jgi:hypothetical protein